MSEHESELRFMATKDNRLSQNDKRAIQWALDRIAALEAENTALQAQAAKGDLLDELEQREWDLIYLASYSGRHWREIRGAFGRVLGRSEPPAGDIADAIRAALAWEQEQKGRTP